MGAPAVMEQSPGRGGTPAPGCPASPGRSTLVSAGISGWEYEEGAGETLTCQGWGPSATSLLSPPPAWCCTQHLGLCLPPGTGSPPHTPTPFPNNTPNNTPSLQPAPSWPPQPPPRRPHSRAATAVLPASLIFWEILHFKAVVLVWTSASTTPPVPSLGFWFQCKVL